MTKAKTVVIKQDEEPIAVEIMAKAIIDIDSSMKKLLNSGLKREAIVTLVHDSCRVAGKASVREVLNALDNLRKNYCTK